MDMPADVYLLAHPDDELWVWPLIRRNPERAFVAYLSASDGGGKFNTAIRSSEVRKALRAVGVSADRIQFLGLDAAIPDGRLHENLDRAFSVAVEWSRNIGMINRIVTHAWEGGHPDHDACHLVARALAKKLGAGERSLAVPGYRRPTIGFPPYVVFSPLLLNGAIRRCQLSLDERWGLFRTMFYHSSQWKTFVGLGPFIAIFAIFSSGLPIQGLLNSSAPARPQPSRLLYEARNGVSFEQFSKAVDQFVKENLSSTNDN